MKPRFRSNKFLLTEVLLLPVFLITLPMMLLSCALKAEETMGVLWRRYTLWKKVVKLWSCFKIQEVCNSLVALVRRFPSGNEL